MKGIDQDEVAVDAREIKHLFDGDEKKARLFIDRICSLGNLAHVAESGRPGRPELLAKKGRIVGGVGCPPNCRTSGKLRGSSGKLRPFRTF